MSTAPNAEPATRTQLLILCYLLGVACGLLAALLVREAGVAPSAATGSGSGSTAPPATDGPIRVDVNLTVPTPAPTATPTSAPPATLGAAGLDFCGVTSSTEGMVCRMPHATATITPTYPACWSPEAEPGTLCQLRGTPTPAPVPSRTPAGFG